MQFTSVRSKEKDYDIYLKSEKLVHNKQEHEKNVSQLFVSGKNCFLAISSLTTLLQLFGERKMWIPAIRTQKMQLTTVRSKEKDYDIYLKSEKLVHSQQENEKNVSQLFVSGKNCFLAISSLTTLLQLFGERKMWIPAIRTQKMQLTTVRSKEKDYDIYLKSEKLVHSQQEHEKNVSQLFGSGKTGSQLFRA